MISTKLSVEIVSDIQDVLTIAIKLKGKLISVVAGEPDKVFKELSKLFESVKALQ